MKTWATAGPDDIFEDLRRAAEMLIEEPVLRPVVVPQWYYDQVLKKMKRLEQREARKARRRRRKTRGW